MTAGDFRAHHARVANPRRSGRPGTLALTSDLEFFDRVPGVAAAPHHRHYGAGDGSGLPDPAGAAQLSKPVSSDKRGSDLIKLFCTPKDDQAFTDPESSPDEWAAFIDRYGRDGRAGCSCAPVNCR